jgi:hypothetical protein
MVEQSNNSTINRRTFFHKNWFRSVRPEIAVTNIERQAWLASLEVSDLVRIARVAGYGSNILYKVEKRTAKRITAHGSFKNNDGQITRTFAGDH